MVPDHIWTLIAKKLSGEANQEELVSLEELLRKNPELHYPLQTIIDLWYSDSQSADHYDAQEALNRHIQRMKDSGIEFNYPPAEESVTDNRYRAGKKMLLGSLLAAVLLIGFYFRGSWATGINKSPAQTVLREFTRSVSQISTKNGTKTNLILPDGTKVWLNAGSSLTYDSSYGRTLREVALSGEAFFDVVKNKEKPFIIHASKINVRVLGTEFNVRAYPTDKTTEASLIRGSIEVTFKDKPSKKVILKPNEKIVVDNDRNGTENMTAASPEAAEKAAKTGGVDVKKLTYENKTGTIIETSWVENKLIFQDESFDDLARQLERWYGVYIVFSNDHLKENRLTGSFKSETIRQALDALKFTASFSYRIDNTNRITIF